MPNPFKNSEPLELSTSEIEPDSWGCMLEGYYWFIKTLFDIMIKSDNFQNKWVLYPLLFNIRHFYELSLKDILVNLENIYRKKFLIKEHKLDVLLKKVSEIMKKYYAENIDRNHTKILIDNIDNCLAIIKKEMEMFIEYDNDSFAFRYPYSKNGNKLIDKSLKIKIIDLFESFKNCRIQLTNISALLTTDPNNPKFDDKM